MEVEEAGRDVWAPPMAETRLAKACDACKSKKIKCDRASPICSYCTKHKLSCHYSAIKKPGLKTGYAKQISERLEDLDSFISQYKPWIEDIGLLKEKYRELEAKYNQLQLYVERQKRGGFLIDKPLDGNSVDPHKDTWSLPDQSTLERLVQCYMEEIHNIFPILHPIRSIPGIVASIQTSPLPSLYGIVVCSLMFGDRFMNSDNSKGTYHYCKSHILNHFSTISDLESLRAMSLLLLRLLMENDVQEYIRISEMVWEGCKKLKLFEEGGSKENVKWIDTEEERYVCWNIHNIYCIGAIFMGQVVPIEELQIPRFLPMSFEMSISGFSQTNQLSLETQKRTLFYNCNGNYHDSTGFIIEAIHKISRLFCSVNRAQQKPSQSGFEAEMIQLNEDVTSWVNSLPDGYRELLQDNDLDTKDNITIPDVLLHGCYNILVLGISTSCILSDETNTEQLLHTCRRCIQSIISVCKKTTTIFNNQKLNRLGFLYIMILCVAANAISVTSAIQGDQELPEYDLIIDLLSDMADTWKLAVSRIDLLIRLKQRFFYDRAKLWSYFTANTFGNRNGSPISLDQSPITSTRANLSPEIMDTFMYQKSTPTVINIFRVSEE